jgi:hypothetical protein
VEARILELKASGLVAVCKQISPPAMREHQLGRAGAAIEHFVTFLACAPADIDGPIGLPDDVKFVLNHEQRIAGSLQTVQCAQHGFRVGWVNRADGSSSTFTTPNRFDRTCLARRRRCSSPGAASACCVQGSPSLTFRTDVHWSRSRRSGRGSGLVKREPDIAALGRHHVRFSTSIGCMFSSIRPPETTRPGCRRGSSLKPPEFGSEGHCPRWRRHDGRPPQLHGLGNFPDRFDLSSPLLNEAFLTWTCQPG